jgi:hypothetical protein
MRAWLLFFGFLLFPVLRGRAIVYQFDYNDNCSQAYQYFLSLHLAEGHDALTNENKINPGNLMATYLADYEDCIVLLLNCDQHDYDERIAHLQERISFIDKGDENDPWYRLCKAGIYLHWAIAEIRFGEQYKALINFRRSFALLKENQRRFPRFEYNTVFSGLEEAVVGSLPGNYKWLASVFGMKGNVKNGTDKLAAFINTHNYKQPLYSETVLYYLYTRFYLLSDQRGAWDFLTGPQFPTHNNLLNAFVKANLALDYRKADAAVATLREAAATADYARYPVFDYQMGVALLDRGDTACVPYFLHYLKENKSGLYIKDCWQKMAFAWYVNGNMKKANYCLSEIKNQGNTRLDADKQASRFAENKVWPVRSLLQARLLIEGGYYDQALSILNQINEASLSIADKAEYNFRLGRIYEETATGSNFSANTRQALTCYRIAMSSGKGRHEQFAARAALQTAKIYEQLGMKKEATDMYQQCLDMPGHDFQNSIDQQAKAGINRVSF